MIVLDRTIYSPTSRNILEGVSLLTVRELADELGYGWVEKDLQPYDVVNAEEALLTTTPYCLAPCTKINGTSVGEGKPGPAFRELISAWGKRVDMDHPRADHGGSCRMKRMTKGFRTACGATVALGDSTTAPRTINGRPLKVYVDLLREAAPAGQREITVCQCRRRQQYDGGMPAPAWEPMYWRSTRSGSLFSSASTTP